ncbi:MAG: hypothetical protein KF819_28565 [Labilithrix sp.]|nr:hypothetical protein [Labilithrix sp.]
MHVRTTATELARWLEETGGSWHIDGEPSLAKSLPLPAPASGVVDALRGRSGPIALLAPDDSGLEDGEPIRPESIGMAAHVVDGERVFQCAWIRPDGTLQDSWLLAEQQGLSGMRNIGTGAAASIIAAFRARKPA